MGQIVIVPACARSFDRSTPFFVRARFDVTVRNQDVRNPVSGMGTPERTLSNDRHTRRQPCPCAIADCNHFSRRCNVCRRHVPARRGRLGVAYFGSRDLDRRAQAQGTSRAPKARADLIISISPPSKAHFLRILSRTVKDPCRMVRSSNIRNEPDHPMAPDPSKDRFSRIIDHVPGGASRKLLVIGDVEVQRDAKLAKIAFAGG
jgi:hypothetical protein